MGADVQLEQEQTYCVFFQPVLPGDSTAGPMRVALAVTAWVGANGPSASDQMLETTEMHKLCGLTPGEYTLGLLGISQKGGKGTCYIRTRFIIDKGDLDLGPQYLAGLASISGQIQIDNGDPKSPKLDGVRVRLLLTDRRMHPNDVLQGNAEENGKFHLAGVYPDTYRMVLENTPERCYLASATQDSRPLQSNLVSVPGGNVRFALSCDGPTIRGRVMAEAKRPDQPVANATVVLATTDGICKNVTRSDQSGTYVFPTGIRPGRYKLVALEPSAETIRHDSPVAPNLLKSAATVVLEHRAVAVQDLVAQPR
jgi:hypothetical protein